MKEDWKKDYCKKFGLCDEKSTKCDCYKELKFIEKLLTTRTQAIISLCERRREKFKCGKCYGAQVQEHTLGCKALTEIIEEITHLT